MTAIATFSNTGLPPIVRVCDSADAPFVVSRDTAPEAQGMTFKVIGVREIAHDTRILPSQRSQ